MMIMHLDKTKPIETADGHKGVFEEKPKPQVKKSRPYECESCDYKTDCLPHLKRHLPTHNKVKKPTKCDKYDFTSQYSTTLERHMKSGKLLLAVLYLTILMNKF